MSHTISIEQASEQLGGLVRALGPGDEIVLTENNKPVARIVRDTSRLRPAHMIGDWKGKVELLDEGDDIILDHFKEYLP